MPVFLGLDCGGSTTRALMVNETGTVLFEGRAGAANLACTPERIWTRNLSQAVEGAPLPDAIAGCFAGLLTSHHASFVTVKLRELFPAAKTIVAHPDYVAAHAASEPEPDFTVVAGTGSIVCSREGDGFAKSGGRGYLLGDFGSAYRYGRETLVRFLEDPTSSSAEVASLVQKMFGSTREQEVLAALYRSRTPSAALSRLASGFKKDLLKGEAYAEEFLSEESRRLAEVVAGHIKRYLRGKSALEGRLAGGLWKLSPRFPAAFCSALKQLVPEVAVSVRASQTPPLVGALRLAKEAYLKA